MAGGGVSFARQRDFTRCRDSATGSRRSAKAAATNQPRVGNDRVTRRRNRTVPSRSDVPEEDDSIGIIQLSRVQREVAIVGRRVGPEDQIREHAESRDEAGGLEQVTALRKGGKGPLERIWCGSVKPLPWRGTESRAKDGVLIAGLRADDRSNAPALQ